MSYGNAENAEKHHAWKAGVNDYNSKEGARVYSSVKSIQASYEDGFRYAAESQLKKIMGQGD